MLLKRLCLAIGLCLLGAPSPALASAPVPESPAREALLMDVATGTILYEKNADQRMPTASMSKTMTAYMVFDALKSGRITLDTKVPISERAWRMQGSKTFVELGNTVRVEDLIRGMLIQSGNDATVALAEELGGSEEGFAAMATAKAHELGLLNSNFANATGWPDPHHYSTARDLAQLALHLIRDFPEDYHYFSELEFTYHGIRQENRDPLLRMNVGADGLKTGHTEESGYGLIGSAQQNDRRLVLVINGLPSVTARADEAARLMKWGFAATGIFPLLKAGDVVDSAAVWMGTAKTVPLVLKQDVTLAMTHEARSALRADVVLQEPTPAPIEAGQQIGHVRITAPGIEPQEIPLYAGNSVPPLGFLGRLGVKMRHYLFGSEDM